MIKKIKILFIGCGKMGGALLEGFVFAGVEAKNIFVVDPNADAAAFNMLGVKLQATVEGLPSDFDFCLVAVKPQNFDEVLAQYNFIDKKCIFISIAAGKNIAKMESILGADSKLIRAMPNLPATISAGVTGYMANKNVTAKELKLVVRLLSTVGEVIEVKNEEQIDIITAISGSGPAYVFHIIEALTNIGKELGFGEVAALTLARAMVYGSAKLAFETNKDPAQLRADVTSKGGTTEAALKVLMGDKKLENLLQTAVKAAIARAKELQ